MDLIIFKSSVKLAYFRLSISGNIWLICSRLLNLSHLLLRKGIGEIVELGLGIGVGIGQTVELYPGLGIGVGIG